MELVYLWVEEYKNIKNQGFNFSPRFKCNFDGKNLTIEEKEYTSIFPDNINITAIVGENGSGKSSIGGEFYAKVTSYILDKKRQYKQTKFLFLISEKKKYYLITNLNNINSISSLKEEIEINNFSSFIELEIKANIYTSCALSEYTGREYSFSDPYVKSNNSILGLMRGEINKSDEKDINTILKKIKFTYKKSKIDHHRQNSKISFPKNNIELRFNSLSFGEKYTLNIFIQILNRLKTKKPYIIFLDEVTMSMHPDWQRQYINDLINLYKEYHVHFIITTHSPFLISDLKKENIIFLKNGKQTHPFKEDEQTFGANIHTLLSHGFFMEDGLMGEFAKEKINEVIQYLNNEKSKIQTIEEAQNIISIIGEPVLKSTLQNMLNEKQYPNDSKLEKLKKEKARLEEEIKQLEEDSNGEN